MAALVVLDPPKGYEELSKDFYKYISLFTAFFVLLYLSKTMAHQADYKELFLYLSLSVVAYHLVFKKIIDVK